MNLYYARLETHIKNNKLFQRWVVPIAILMTQLMWLCINVVTFVSLYQGGDKNPFAAGCLFFVTVCSMFTGTFFICNKLKEYKKSKENPDGKE